MSPTEPPPLFEPGILTTVQLEAARRIEARPYFADIPVLTEKKGNIEREIAIKVGKGGGGVCVVILTAWGRCEYSNLVDLYFSEIHVFLNVFENVVINQSDTGTNKPASDIAERAMAALIKPFVGSQFGFVPHQDGVQLLPNNSNLLAYSCHLTSHGGIKITDN